MTYRILCPHHKEDTPSCVVYATGYHCFGCGASGPLSALNMELPKILYTPKKENLENSLKRIALLPKCPIRGLMLPADDMGYYIVWPNGEFYKKRLFNGAQRYYTPSGYSAPLLKLKIKGNRSIVVVEGELNALSILDVLPNKWDLVSPGPATSFSRLDLLTLLKKYDNIVIIGDADAAGLAAARSLKQELLKFTHSVKIYLDITDLNDKLNIYGKEYVKNEVGTMLKVP